MLLVGWLRLCCCVGEKDDVDDDDDDDVVHSFTYSKPKCGVVCDFDGCGWCDALCVDCRWLGYDWCRIWFCCILIFKWYRLFVPILLFCSLLSMALLPLLVRFVHVSMGLRVSIGRISMRQSMMPLIVSAGPTMTLSHGPSIFVKLIRFKPSSMSSLLLATLCFGTGGAFALGTSNSHAVKLSEDDAVAFELFDEVTRLFALCICGFNNRFIAELSATFGDALRGGSGGAAEVWFAFVTSLAIVVCTLLNALFIICGNCCCAWDSWLWVTGCCWE